MEEEVLGKAYDSRLMRRLLGYMRPYRLRVALSLVFLLAQSVLQILGPLLTRTAVDRYLQPKSGKATTFLDAILPADPMDGDLTRIALLYFGVLAGIFFTEFAQMYLMQYTGQLAMFDLRRQLMEHLQRLDLSFYDRNPVGRLVTRVTTDVDVLNDLFASGLVTILGDVLVLAFIVAVMFRLSPLLTGIMLAAMPLRDSGDHRLPPQCHPELSADPRGHRQDQLVSAGARHRDGGTPVVQPGAAQRAGVRGDQPRAHECLQKRHHGIRLVLSGGGIHLDDRAGRHPDLRRLPHREGRLDARGGRRVSAIRVAILPPDPGSEREVQHSAGRMASSERIFKLLDTPPTVLAPAVPRAVSGERRHRVRARVVRV